MKHWIAGIALAVLAFVLLYASAGMSQEAPQGSLALFLACVLSILGIFFVIAQGSKHMTPNYRGGINTDRGGPRAEIAAGPGQNPWAGTGKTLGVSLVGLVGLLVYVGIYVGAWADVMGWLIYLAVAMTFAMLVVVVMLTAGKTD